MRNVIFLAIVAILTITVLLIIFNPQVLSDVWLWIIGLIGPIIAFIRIGAESIANLFKKAEQEKPSPGSKRKSKPNEIDESDSLQSEKVRALEKEVLRLENILKESLDSFDGTTITVFRYFDDGVTTLGLLFFDDRFYCYTLEDTYRKVNKPRETRIFKGVYDLDFYKAVTPLTKKYRELFEWFDYHLQIQNVPNFTNVYIHSGSYHTHTEGCLLIADSIMSSSAERKIFNSGKTFERFYKEIQRLRVDDVAVRVKIFDENWVESNDLKNRKV